LNLPVKFQIDDKRGKASGALDFGLQVVISVEKQSAQIKVWKPDIVTRDEAKLSYFECERF
jgi:hypothetical protein